MNEPTTEAFNASPHRADTPERTESEQQAFFDAAMRCTARAAARTGVIRRTYALAGTRITLEFAGDQLLDDLTMALEHLRDDSGLPPDLTLHVWDSESTGEEMLPPPCRQDCFTERGDIWGMNSARFRSAFHWHEFSVNLLDLDQCVGIFWVASRDRLPYWARSSPLRTLLHWWMEKNNCQLLHAAAVGTADGALLITGQGGVGKSTTALCSLVAGLDYISDDYLVVQLDPAPMVHSLYSTAKLDPAQLERFPTLRASVINEPVAPGEKAVVRLWPDFAGQVKRSLPLTAVATPRFGNSPTTTAGPAPRAALQRAAAFTTMSQLPHAGRWTHDYVDRLVNSLPGILLTLGNDLDAIPENIRALLALEPIALRDLAREEEIPMADRALPLLSVIIPVYNGADFLEHAVAHVLAQDYPAKEIIVVDDGSTDTIDEVASRFPAEIRVLRQDNYGPAAARNRGIRDAHGEIFAFLDVDDRWPKGVLTSAVDRLLSDPAIDVVHGRGQVTRFTEHDSPGEYLGSAMDAFPCYIGAGVYRRRAMERVGLFDTQLRFGEDMDWFTRADEAGVRLQRVDEITLFVRRHANNMTRGRTPAELNPLRLVKKALDRQRRLLNTDSADELAVNPDQLMPESESAQ